MINNMNGLVYTARRMRNRSLHHGSCGNLHHYSSEHPGKLKGFQILAAQIPSNLQAIQLADFDLC